MPYSKKIEELVDAEISRWRKIEKKRMFGGICYLLKGNMCFGIHRDSLIVRLGPEGAAERLEEKGVRPFDITGRPMKGWVMVSPKGWEGEKALKEWLEDGRTFARSLPAKEGKGR